MLNYAGEYGEYCDARQAAATVIRSSDAALKSCLECLTMSYIVSDRACLISGVMLNYTGEYGEYCDTGDV